ncbi:MAG: leucyl/phenylalanyl-tRNA--protein transferase [Alphaproteobacteria bacterium]|nr:MAG: leucyl/phenylalanyl-tRNA--protein transferase [Alphaproteobacteria bacterium]
MVKVTPDLLLDAYRAGIFPMAEDRRATEIGWYDPPLRGILPIAGLHVPRRLARTISRKPYRVTFDTDFERVIRNCADARETTWINDEIISLYTALHARGHAHSAEAWDGAVLAGGVYGVSIGSAFFGESMFSVRTDASKIALVHLVARLWKQGYELFDAQYVNAHLKQFGIMEIPRAEYRRLLRKAVAKPATFGASQSAPSSLSAALSPSSNDPGSFSSGGTDECAGGGRNFCAGFSSGDLVAGGEAGAGAASGLTRSAALSGAGAAPCTKPMSSSLPVSGCASGARSGAVSEENSSDLDVVAFLHSITQTS